MEESRARTISLLHKYYDWQLIESLPLSTLGELLSYAEKKEQEELEQELERRLFPLWLANYAVAKMNGEEVMEYGEFLKKTMKNDNKTPISLKKRTAEEIQAEFAPIIAADQKGRD